MIPMFEEHAKVFEDCVMSDDSQQFIKSLPDSFEKKLLHFITKEHSEKFEEEIKELKKQNRYFWDTLDQYKTTDKLL